MERLIRGFLTLVLYVMCFFDIYTSSVRSNQCENEKDTFILGRSCSCISYHRYHRVILSVIRSDLSLAMERSLLMEIEGKFESVLQPDRQRSCPVGPTRVTNEGYLDIVMFSKMHASTLSRSRKNH